MKIRITALLLTALMLIFTVGCANDGDKTQETTVAGSDSTAPVETVADTSPQFAEADYEGAEFTVLSRNSSAASYPGFYITSDNVVDTMSEATYMRNLAVEDKYKVKIMNIEEEKPYDKIRVYLDSGDVSFDLVLDQRSRMSSLAQSGYLYDFNALDHVDFSNPWWDSNAADGYEIAGKLFFMANDISVSNLAGARFFYFNKALITQYSLDNPYELVEKNQWTLDNYLKMVESVSTDNGDGVWDGSDTYGLLCETDGSNGNQMHLMVGCGIKFVEKANDGTLITNAGSEKTQDIITKIAAVMRDTPYVLTYTQAATGADTTGFGNKYNYGRSLFATDHFLFVQNGMGIADQFKDMKSDYGIAPNPKYDSAQESYYHKMDKYSLIWAMPNCAMDYDRAGIILEYWSYQSSLTVMPAYYEITIKTKRVQEETASRMLDLIKGSIRYDLTDLFSVDVIDVVYSGYMSGNLSSSWASFKKVIDKKLDKLYTDIDTLG